MSEEPLTSDEQQTAAGTPTLPAAPDETVEASQASAPDAAGPPAENGAPMSEAGAPDQASGAAGTEEAANVAPEEPAASTSAGAPAGDASAGEPAAPDDEVQAEVAATAESAEQSATAGEPGAAEAVAQPTEAPSEVARFEPPDFAGQPSGARVSAIELLDDVELDVKIELGRAGMYIEDVLRLGVGSVVELDKAAGDPVDVFVNDRLVARGEVLVLNDNFCVRINDIVSPIPGLEREQ